MTEDFNRSLIVICIIIVCTGIILVSTVLVGEIADRDKFAKTEQEDEALFGKYNDDYEPKVTNEEDGRLVVLDVEAKHYKGRGNKAVVNYLSNVGGKLISVNGVDVKGSSGSLMPFAIPGTGTMGMMRRGGESEKKRNIFVILVPKDAPLVDNLEERIERYAKYSK